MVMDYIIIPNKEYAMSIVTKRTPVKTATTATNNNFDIVSLSTTTSRTTCSTQVDTKSSSSTRQHRLHRWIGSSNAGNRIRPMTNTIITTTKQKRTMKPSCSTRVINLSVQPERPIPAYELYVRYEARRLVQEENSERNDPNEWIYSVDDVTRFIRKGRFCVNDHEVWASSRLDIQALTGTTDLALLLAKRWEEIDDIERHVFHTCSKMGVIQYQQDKSPNPESMTTSTNQTSPCNTPITKKRKMEESIEEHADEATQDDAETDTEEEEEVGENEQAEEFPTQCISILTPEPKKQRHQHPPIVTPNQESKPITTTNLGAILASEDEHVLAPEKETFCRSFSPPIQEKHSNRSSKTRKSLDGENSRESAMLAMRDHMHNLQQQINKQNSILAMLLEQQMRRGRQKLDHFRSEQAIGSRQNQQQQRQQQLPLLFSSKPVGAPNVRFSPYIIPTNHLPPTTTQSTRSFDDTHRRPDHYETINTSPSFCHHNRLTATRSDDETVQWDAIELSDNDDHHPNHTEVHDDTDTFSIDDLDFLATDLFENSSTFGGYSIAGDYHYDDMPFRLYDDEETTSDEAKDPNSTVTKRSSVSIEPEDSVLNGPDQLPAIVPPSKYPFATPATVWDSNIGDVRTSYTGRHKSMSNIIPEQVKSKPTLCRFVK